jgi:phospholipid/cholesterol/gamma-HCH transport system substrate-binding protein
VIYPDGRQETTVSEITKATDTYTVNFQVGWHYEDYTLRAGIFESKGGVGIDRMVARNKLRLSLEAYDFTRTEKPPHIRVEGRYFITRNLFAFAGWDDPTWSQRSSYLFGGGITWGDEDVKYLLGTAASAAPR